MTRGTTKLSLAVLLTALALALAACGSSSSSSSNSSSAAPAAASSSTDQTQSTATTKLAKTKFVLHAGLAFGAFHRYIYKPFKAGDLSHPLQHKLTTLKAAAAGGFVYHELKLALADAQADPTLSHLVAPITALQGSFHSLGSKLKGGNVDPAEIDNLNGSIGSVSQQSAAAGHPIQEQSPATI